MKRLGAVEHSPASLRHQAQGQVWTGRLGLQHDRGLLDFEWMSGHYPAGVQFTNLHTPVWWGGCWRSGVACLVKFWPGKAERRQNLHGNNHGASV